MIVIVALDLDMISRLVQRLVADPDRRLALVQRACPVTQDLLGSMGKPIKMQVGVRAVFACCEECVETVRKEPRAPFITASA